ncbi:hypothetical protein JZ751_014252 [Albula glossodonta]|uniref:Leucine-rich repeat and calponin homology domain-containing protein 3 n=1 Tax=Albula glossodonta TaxID=121402 RepID=A0A8T2NVY8_9TELE|nr:hypothetical protein JZ751_014252 [Albula glossodonta]
MAAAVLLAAESPGPSYAVGSAGEVIVSGNVLGAAGPASWNRALDRALDEASATGCLNLSGRKLKEFPRSAANHDLSDTTRADLSRNRLGELPVEVCMFVSLENLNLYQNCLRSLPESLINLQALTYLNISRNQLSSVPAHVCSLPLKVLIACNNKLVSLPEELGQLRQLTELLAELPLVRLDFSCNKVTSIPVCYRNLRHLQSIMLDNNPLQSPPAQICIKGKIHIFKYLNVEAAEMLYPGRSYGALDSGFNSVDSGDKRWSGNEVRDGYTGKSCGINHLQLFNSCGETPSEELAELPLRVAEITKDNRHRGRSGVTVSNGSVEAESEQIDFIDSSCLEDVDEGRSRRAESFQNGGNMSPSVGHKQRSAGLAAGTGAAGLEHVRREAQLAAMQYEEERHRGRHFQKEPILTYAKLKAAQNPSKLNPTENESGVESFVVFEVDTDTNTIKRKPDTPEQSEDRSPLSSGSSGTPSALQSPSSSGPLAAPSCRGPSPRPNSFLFRMGQREDARRADGGVTKAECEEAASPPAPGLEGEEAELVEQLRKNIESRLKVSLPSDLGAALTDGVAQLCLPLHILEEKGLPLVAGTVSALLELAPPKHTSTSSSSCTTSTVAI